MSMISEQIGRLKCQSDYIRQVISECKGIADCIDEAIDTIETLSAKVRVNHLHGGWIPCSDRLPRPKGDSCWARCIVSVMRSHYPTSTYDICDAPYDEEYVMYANYDVVQKIWHLDSDEQVNALISIEDVPLNGDCVVAWMPLPEPYKED